MNKDSCDTPPLLFARQVREGIHVLEVYGEVDFSVRKQFEAGLISAVDGVHSPLIIDLTHVRYMDTSGFNALVRAKRKMTARNDELFIVLQDRHLKKVFQILNFYTLFRVHETLDEAVAAAKS